MSLWPREEYRIVLRPHQVVLARMAREFTGRGWQNRVLEKKVVSCRRAAGQATWSGAIAVLESALPELAERHASAKVILSNHFVRYALIPQSDALEGEKEELAYVQHVFKEMYGSDVTRWELRISADAGQTQVASAVDAALLAALRELFERLQIELKAIQPHLMHAYNACLTDLHRSSAWLALVESGNLCLALLQQGRWSWMRTIRTGAHWHKELPFLLNREALVANIEHNVDEVLLWAPDHPGVEVRSAERWKIRHLQPAVMPRFDPGLGSRYAMYMSE